MKLTPTSKLAILTTLAVVPFATMSLVFLPADVIAGSATIATLAGIGAMELKGSSATKSDQRHVMNRECCNS